MQPHRSTPPHMSKDMIMNPPQTLPNKPTSTPTTLRRPHSRLPSTVAASSRRPSSHVFSKGPHVADQKQSPRPPPAQPSANLPSEPSVLHQTPPTNVPAYNPGATYQGVDTASGPSSGQSSTSNIAQYYPKASNWVHNGTTYYSHPAPQAPDPSSHAAMALAYSQACAASADYPQAYPHTPAQAVNPPSHPTYADHWPQNGGSHYSQSCPPDVEPPSHNSYAYPQASGPWWNSSHVYPRPPVLATIPSSYPTYRHLGTSIAAHHDPYARSRILDQKVFFNDRAECELSEAQASTLKFVIEVAHRFVFSEKSLRILHRKLDGLVSFQDRANHHVPQALNALAQSDGMSVVIDDMTFFAGLVRDDDPSVLRVNATVSGPTSNRMKTDGFSWSSKRCEPAIERDIGVKYSTSLQ
jgi:hypothetical protein